MFRYQQFCTFVSNFYVNYWIYYKCQTCEQWKLLVKLSNSDFGSYTKAVLGIAKILESKKKNFELCWISETTILQTCKDKLTCFKAK